MSKPHGLPAAATVKIINSARDSLFIPGTNKFALVCKRWRDEYDDTPSELQLHLKQRARTKKDVREARQWLCFHGSHIFALDVDMKRKLMWSLLGSIGLCSNLVHLSICGTNSLAGLLATGVQLPHLQHLTACLDQYKRWPLDDDQILLLRREDQMLARSSKAGDKVYPLQQACPGLVGLQLYLDATCTSEQDGPDTFDDLEELLPALLPPTLQRLGLQWDTAASPQGSMEPEAVTHLTALCHLALWNVDITPELSPALPEGCTLRLAQCLTWNPAPLSDRRLALVMDCGVEDATAIRHLTRLTSLSLSELQPGDDGEYLTCLTALQQLTLHAWDAADQQVAVECLGHATAVGGLSFLELRTKAYDNRALLAAVGKLTQLSSLCLSPGTSLGVMRLSSRQLAAGPQAVAPGGALAALQGLVGLRQLELSAGHLLRHPTGWLAHLAQLTLLAVDCGQLQQQRPPGRHQLRTEQQQVLVAGCVAALAPRLQVSFACLKQVVLYVTGARMGEVVPSLLPGVSTMVQAQRLS